MAFLADDSLDTESYQEISRLPVPGPTVVLDMRSWGETHLLAYFSTEIAEIAREMRLQGVAQWENLAACFSFLTISLDRSSTVLGTEECYEVTPVGQPLQPFLLTEKFIEYLGETIKATRNRRIEAMEQYERVSRDLGGYQSGLGQSTVRVVVLVDLKEQISETALTFERAVQIVTALKEWSAGDFGGRGALLEIVAVCFNAHLSRHYAKLSSQAADTFHTFILLETYRQDYGHLNEYAQNSYAELLLSALFLHWPVLLQPHIEDALPVALNGEEEQLSATRYLLRPTYILGAAAVEEPTRWGAHWLYYGLAASMLGRLLDGQEPLSEEPSLFSDVQNWFAEWWKNVQKDIPTLWFGHVPSLQGLSRLGAYGQVNLTAASPAELSRQLRQLRAEIHELYLTDPIASLQTMLGRMSDPLAVNRQISQPTGWSADQWQAYQQQLHAPASLLETFFIGQLPQVRGCIPRARRQLEHLKTCVEQELRSAPWNPHQGWVEFDSWERRAQATLATFEKKARRRWRKKVPKEIWSELQEGVKGVFTRHYAACCRALASWYALALLQEAELYDPNGKPCPYAQRLEQLAQQMQAASAQASQQQRIASQRLALGGDRQLPPLDPVAREPGTLRNRQNRLKHEKLRETYLHAYQQLKAKPPAESPFLRFFAESLLRHLGSKQVKRKHKRRVNLSAIVSESESLVRERLQILETLLATTFMAARVGNTEVIDLAPLLEERQLIKSRLLMAENALDSEVREIEEIVTTAKLEEAITQQSSQTERLQTMPIERVLAALLANQPRDEEIQALLDPRNLLNFLVDPRTNRENLLRELDRQSVLTGGHLDRHAPHETVYLYLPANSAVPLFKRVLDALQTPDVIMIPIPTGEKILYLRVYRQHQFTDNLHLPAGLNGSTNLEKRKD